MGPKPIRTILIATDFSADSDRALELGTDLAKRLGARVRVVHAFDLPLPMVHPYEVTVPDAYIEECYAAAEKRLEAAREQVERQGVEADAKLVEVPAAPAIVAAAREVGCELIVLGTRGNRGLKHVLLGSVAARTLRLAPCPVLVVKAEDD